MQVVIQIPFGLPPPRSWPKGQLLGLGSLVVLSAYRVEYGYAALVLYNTIMTIYTGILSLTPLSPLATLSALVGPATKHSMLTTHQILGTGPNATL